MRRGRPKNSEYRLSSDKLQVLKDAKAVMEKNFPSLFMSLNVAQYRALETMYAIDKKTGCIPDMTSVEFANGVGKTHLLILDIIGWTMGPEYLNAESFPEETIEWYNRAKKLRDRGLLNLRLVCVSDDMKHKGSVYDLLKKVFPWAKIKDRDSSHCYRSIAVQHPDKPNIVNYISVKTFEQSEIAMSGSTCHRIWINEPMPDDKWGETQSRIRTEVGEIQGSFGMFATILDHALFLDTLEDSDKFILKRIRGHIFENCVGDQVTDEMALEVYNTIGVELEKNPDGPGYLTNGVLTRETVEKKIDGWARSCPHQLDARKTGAPISAGGKIYLNFDRDVHVIPDDTYLSVLERCPVGQVVDPHPARPDASIWFQILPSDRIAIVDEWPTYEEFGYFDKIKDNRFTVPEKCEIWSLFESTRGYEAGGNRIGDPNMFREPNSNDPGMLLDQYSEYGFNYYIDVEDSLEYGHELVNQYLWYDQNVRKFAPNDPAGQPRLVVYDRCINTIRSCQNYARKKSKDHAVLDTPDKKFACFASLIRYLVVWHQDHRFENLEKNGNKYDDSDLVKMGRIPKKYRDESGIKVNYPFNTHGRHVLSYGRR